jgi:hypothetical protein
MDDDTLAQELKRYEIVCVLTGILVGLLNSIDFQPILMPTEWGPSPTSFHVDENCVSSPRTVRPSTLLY